MTGQIPFPENFGGGGKLYIRSIPRIYLFFQYTLVGQVHKDHHGYF